MYNNRKKNKIENKVERRMKWEINKNFVRKMLGIADRSKILNLLNFIFQGEQKKSIAQLREMINEGVEPTHFLNDLLEIIYFVIMQMHLFVNQFGLRSLMMKN